MSEVAARERYLISLPPLAEPLPASHALVPLSAAENLPVPVAPKLAVQDELNRARDVVTQGRATFARMTRGLADGERTLTQRARDRLDLGGVLGWGVLSAFTGIGAGFTAMAVCGDANLLLWGAGFGFGAYLPLAAASAALAALGRKQLARKIERADMEPMVDLVKKRSGTEQAVAAHFVAGWRGPLDRAEALRHNAHLALVENDQAVLALPKADWERAQQLRCMVDVVDNSLPSVTPQTLKTLRLLIDGFPVDEREELATWAIDAIRRSGKPVDYLADRALIELGGSYAQPAVEPAQATEAEPLR